MHAVNLHGDLPDMPQLRGVLIQSRMVADDVTTVGSFAVSENSADDTKLSDCTRPEVRHTAHVSYMSS